MIERASGIVLRTRRLTETSLIVQWLTPESGRIATVGKGALRPKSPFRGKLDLFYLADFTFSRSRRSELHTLREVSLRSTHSALRRELGYLRQASYCAALIEQTTETETPLPEIFALMRGFLTALPRQAPGPHSVLAFEIKLLNELGLKPDPRTHRLTPAGAQLLAVVSESNWEKVATANLDSAAVLELEQFLHGFLTYHLGRVARGRDAALNPARQR